MYSFKEFVTEHRGNYLRINPTTGLPRKRRHIDSMFANPDIRPVPKCHRADNNSVQEFESLKQMPKGTKTINLAKARKLQAKFNLRDTRGTLGNTGIFLAPHHEPGFFTLTK
jgi:hypothetical protein